MTEGLLQWEAGESSVLASGRSLLEMHEQGAQASHTPPVLDLFVSDLVSHLLPSLFSPSL